MSENLNLSILKDLDKMEKSGTLKNFHYISSPMQTEVEMENTGKVLVLSSNNYLGLANHPKVVEAGKKALDTYGAGTASVRFICGTFSIHKKIEEAIAKLHNTQSALTYVSCMSANAGLIPAITTKEDAIISDELNHASLIDGCRLSKAKRLIYKHSNMESLEEKLKEVSLLRRIIIITDGVFSMEGDIAPLDKIVELAKKYNASVIVDDSHGVGVLGKTGKGTAEHFGVEKEIDITTGTLGKALGGGAGGYVAASKEVIKCLEQTSRTQIFSNALPATIAASSLEAINILQNEPQRVEKLRNLTKKMRDGLKEKGFKPLEGSSAIVPIIVGETYLAIKMSKQLLKEGVFVTGFGFPVVPEGSARIRIQISATLTDAQIQLAINKIAKIGLKLGII